MRILLDTQAFLWWITDDTRLSATARELIGDGGNQLLLSTASAWEIAIKTQIGRLSLPDSPVRFVPGQLATNAIEPLPVLLAHGLRVAELPLLHRDPFDRLLVSQCQVEKLPILTADALVSQYDVDVLW